MGVLPCVLWWRPRVDRPLTLDVGEDGRPYVYDSDEELVEAIDSALDFKGSELFVVGTGNKVLHIQVVA